MKADLLPRTSNSFVTRSLVRCEKCGVNVRQDHLHRHIAKHHADADRSRISVNEAKPIDITYVKLGKLLRPCPTCGVSVREDRLTKHLTKAHANVGAKVLEAKQIPIKVLAAYSLKAQRRARKREQKKARKRMLAITKKQQTIAKQSPVKTLKEEPKRSKCGECGAVVRDNCMDLHIKNCHAPTDSSNPIPTARLPFMLLPPGTWEISQVVDHFRRVADKLSSGLTQRQVDPSRLEA